MKCVSARRRSVLKGFEKEIEFRDVRFSYEREGEAKEVLHGITLTVTRGEVVALVGPSGAGKSTLVNLLPRFFDVTGGAILLDGQDVRDLTLVSLRKQIGKVTQETVLFNDTVRNNIAYGQPDVPMERIEAAARAALAHDFILSDAGRLRHDDWRARDAAFRRRAAAAGDCAGAAEECADTGAG